MTFLRKNFVVEKQGSWMSETFILIILNNILLMKWVPTSGLTSSAGKLKENSILTLMVGETAELN